MNLLAYGDKLVGSTSGGGSGSGGHTIKNQSGQGMAQEAALQFKDAHVSDDSAGGNTKIEVIKEVTLAQFNELPTDGSADGIYKIGDGQGGSGIEADEIDYDNTGSGLTATNVQDAIDEIAQGGGGGATLLGSVTSDGVKTRAQLLEDLKTAVSGEDLKGAYFITDNDVFQINNVNTGEFSRASVFTNTATISSIILSAHTWQVMNIASGGTNTFSDVSSNVPTSGKTYSIYR